MLTALFLVHFLHAPPGHQTPKDCSIGRMQFLCSITLPLTKYGLPARKRKPEMCDLFSKGLCKKLTGVTEIRCLFKNGPLIFNSTYVYLKECAIRKITRPERYNSKKGTCFAFCQLWLDLQNQIWFPESHQK